MFLCGERHIFWLKNTILFLWSCFHNWGIVRCFRFFVFVKVVWFLSKHLWFFVKGLWFFAKVVWFLSKVLRFLSKVVLRMFTNILLILSVCAFFGFWGFLWAWNLSTFRVYTIVRWYTNTGSVGFFSSFFSLAIVHFQVYFCNCSRFITICNGVHIILFYICNCTFSTVLYSFKPKIYSRTNLGVIFLPHYTIRRCFTDDFYRKGNQMLSYMQ